MSEERPKKKRKKAATDDGSGKEHKPNWKETTASVMELVDKYFALPTAAMRGSSCMCRMPYRSSVAAAR